MTQKEKSNNTHKTSGHLYYLRGLGLPQQLQLCQVMASLLIQSINLRQHLKEAHFWSIASSLQQVPQNLCLLLAPMKIQKYV